MVVLPFTLPILSCRLNDSALRYELSVLKGCQDLVFWWKHLFSWNKKDGGQYKSFGCLVRLCVLGCVTHLRCSDTPISNGWSLEESSPSGPQPSLGVLMLNLDALQLAGPQWLDRSLPLSSRLPAYILPLMPEPTGASLCCFSHLTNRCLSCHQIPLGKSWESSRSNVHPLTRPSWASCWYLPFFLSAASSQLSFHGTLTPPGRSPPPLATASWCQASGWRTVAPLGSGASSQGQPPWDACSCFGWLLLLLLCSRMSVSTAYKKNNNNCTT